MVPHVEGKVVGQVVSALLASNARSATKFLNEKLVVRVSRPVYKGKLDGAGKRARRVGLVLTIGEPNYEARDFIKKCKRAGEPFPVKKIQVKFPPKAKRR